MDENSVTDAFVRKIVIQHNWFIKTWNDGVGNILGPACGFLLFYSDSPTQYRNSETISFPNDSYVIPILKVKTTASDVRMWINGMMEGKHADMGLRA